MAVVVGQFIVTNKNKTVNDYAFGLKYPFTMTNNTFELTYNNITRLKANLKNLLSTSLGERIGQPTFGTRLNSLLFEVQSDELNQKIFDEINRAVNFWIPQVSINQIEVTSTPDMLDRGQVEINVVFTANYTSEEFDVNFKVNN